MATTSVLVGWLPDDSGRDAVGWAGRAAATAREARPGRSVDRAPSEQPRVLVRCCTVLPRTWPFPTSNAADADYRRWVRDRGDESVRAAHDALTDVLHPDELDQPAAFHVDNPAESAGLIGAAATHHTDIVVLGSTDGPPGRFSSGSTSDALLHSSRVPLALVPRGYAERRGPFRRIACAYTGTAESDDAVDTAAVLADRWNLQLHLVAFAPRRSTTFPPLGGYGAEDLVTAQWSEQATGLLRAAATRVGTTYPALTPTCAVGVGGGWEDVLRSVDLVDDDVLVLGSSRPGPLARVFLGSTATKIVRHSPVPVIVVPRGSRLGSARPAHSSKETA
ncbi:universal stress protein [Rhodococcoides corynebacterioides]|uniref:Universal stress protein n=1 Tax=Rhodococcoides corynebacterioides TaxID=53972 RepID=A0ABS7P7H1_9NOCA|nr:universal stress protein [Rhodococcus corynebacterioides]MBY6368371.1 universal stress protein [Rhodococcus corynebacterioides]MBY6407564.1 universal stress protein [Rhodococcus corynebacterioides]